MAPNFHFCALFAISDNKQRVWYITRGIYPAFLENRFFKTHFALLAVFTKSATVRKRPVVEKCMRFSALKYKTTYVPTFFFLLFEAKSQFQGENKNYFEKKNHKILIIFPLRGMISAEPLVRY